MLKNYQVGLLTTFILGIFILIGALVALLVKRKNKIINFSMGLAFGVIVGLIITDLLPEIFENLGLKHIYLFIIFTIVGFFILKALDQYIPDHHEEKKLSKEEANGNLMHIGIMTTCVLVLHNLIEGMAVYSSALSDPKLGVSLAFGVGFHNIPLGIVIASSFYHSSKNKKNTIIPIFIVAASTFLGGLIMYIFNIKTIGNLLLGTLLSITLGMLIFIIVDELLVKIRNTKEKDLAYSGVLVGIIILCISALIG